MNRRDRTSHRTIARATTENATGRFKVGDVVTTGKRVRPTGPSGKKEGHAAPGWLWRVVAVRYDFIGKANSKAIFYDCVAHTAPDAYKVTLRDNQIDGKVIPPQVKARYTDERVLFSKAEFDQINKWRAWREERAKLRQGESAGG